MESLKNAKHALEQACNALSMLRPNARDYYPQGPRVIYDAINEHEERVCKVAEVKDEIDAMILAIDDL
jgi:hypothetical protein